MVVVPSLSLEIKRLLVTLNIDLPAKAIEAKFKKVDLDNSNSWILTVVYFVDLLRKRPRAGICGHSCSP